MVSGANMTVADRISSGFSELMPPWIELVRTLLFSILVFRVDLIKLPEPLLNHLCFLEGWIIFLKQSWGTGGGNLHRWEEPVSAGGQSPSYHGMVDADINWEKWGLHCGWSSFVTSWTSCWWTLGVILIDEPFLEGLNVHVFYLCGWMAAFCVSV